MRRRKIMRYPANSRGMEFDTPVKASLKRESFAGTCRQFNVRETPCEDFGKDSYDITYRTADGEEKTITMTIPEMHGLNDIRNGKHTAFATN